MTTRTAFVERFGEDNALALEDAAEQHVGGRGDDRGTDPFQYVLLACIGYECVGRFADSHGVTADTGELKEWVYEHAELAHFQGDPPDYLSLISGGYDGWLKP